MNSFLLRRGVNIGGWLSQSKRRGRERVEFFTRDDAARLARMGFNHLRIPVDEEQLWDDAGKREAEAWTLLNTALDWCAEYGLNAVVDLHILRSHYFMAKEKPLFTIPREAERFGELWDELSSELLSRDVARVYWRAMSSTAVMAAPRLTGTACICGCSGTPRPLSRGPVLGFVRPGGRTCTVEEGREEDPVTPGTGCGTRAGQRRSRQGQGSSRRIVIA